MSRLIKKNTNIMYVSVKEEDFKKKVSTNANYIVFHVRVHNHLTFYHSVVETYNNIKKLLDSLDKSL
jgi:3-phenylpropionate/cinnamic acid dioxygenase small subunit